MNRIFRHRSAARPAVGCPNSFRAYIVIHKIHLMNLKNAATLVRRPEKVRVCLCLIQTKPEQGGNMGFAQNSLDTRAVSRYGACSRKHVFVHSAMKSIACVLLCFLFATFVAHAQGVGSSGEITGTVTDSSGAILPKVAVNVVEIQTGLKRTATTDGTGQFRVVGLSPATYDVSAQMTGFATEIRKSVTVAHRADGNLRFQDETVTGRGGSRGDGPAARGGN